MHPILYTKYAHLLVKVSKIVGADTSLQTKLCTVTFFIEELAKRCPLAVWYASFWHADSCLVKTIPH